MLRLFAPPTESPFRWGTTGLISLAIHVLVLAPFVWPFSDQPRNDVMEQFVVFLAPPEREASPETVGKGIEWSGLNGNGGAISDEAVTPTDQPLTHGEAGAIDPNPPVLPGDYQPVETAMSEIEVDSTVIRDPSSGAPVYPAAMLEQNIEGSTFVHYVVDTNGMVDTATIRVIRTSRAEFARAVRDALAIMRFRPAIHASQRVRQWVEQNFSFRIVASPSTPSPPASTNPLLL